MGAFWYAGGSVRGVSDSRRTTGAINNRRSAVTQQKGRRAAARIPPPQYTHLLTKGQAARSRQDWCRFVKETIEGSHLDPLVICALRYGLASLLLLPALVGPGLSKVNWGLSFELGFALFCAYQSQTRQLMTETASQGSIMLAVFILLVPVVELVFGRPFTRKKVLSLAVALFGISLLGAGSASSICNNACCTKSSLTHTLSVSIVCFLSL